MMTALGGSVRPPSAAFATSPTAAFERHGFGRLRRVTGSLRVTVVVIVVIVVIFVAVAFVFLVWLLSKDDIGCCRSTTRV